MDVRHLGQAGVYRVASELALRKMEVYFPSVDVGIDLLTGNGKRLQIKTATLRDRLTGRGYYISLGWGQRGSNQRAVRRARKYSEEVDLVVIWGVDEDRFWIAPATIFDSGQCLLLRPGRTEPANNATGFAKAVYTYEDRWDLIVPEPFEVELPAPASAVVDVEAFLRS
jgi:hypothetical protein